jgi:DNA mismatch repair protein MutS2
MRQFLEVADDRTLLLLDEFGTGSDPELGGALAEVFFEQLYDKGAFGVITTHYSNIKFKASDLEHAQNASMLFDTETLMPRYRLSMGQPGSSFTFEVAQMNGIPSDLIDQAKELLDDQTVELDRLIATLQSEKDRIERERSLIQDDRQQTKRAKQSFEDREAQFLRRLETQQKQIDRNNKYLSSGKKMHAFVDRFKLGKANKELMGEVKKFLTIEKTKIEEAKKLIALREKAEAKSAAKQRRRKKKPKSEVPLKVGSKVRLAKSNQRGEVIELEGEKVVVMFGSFRTQVTRDKLVVEE